MDEWNHTSRNSQISQTNNSHTIGEDTLNVLKDNKGKAFVLEYSSRKGKRGFQEEKVVGKEKVQKIKNCQEKRKLLGEGKAFRKRERKKRLSREVKVVGGRE
ncbi:25875_t:CDS:2, partial [Gigaspora margarita]